MKEPSPTEVIAACCQALGTTLEELARPGKAEPCASYRHIVTVELLQAGASIGEAARLLGRHRTTAYSSRARYAGHFQHWPEFRAQALACREAVEGIGETLCADCRKQLRGEELESPSRSTWGEPVCDECYQYNYQDHCPLCEEYYDRPKKPEDTFFFLIRHTAHELRMKPGFYRVLAFPYYFGGVVTGFDDFNLDRISLARECDIQAIQKPEGVEPVDHSGECCLDCFEKYVKA